MYRDTEPVWRWSEEQDALEMQQPRRRSRSPSFSSKEITSDPSVRDVTDGYYSLDLAGTEANRRFARDA